MKVSTRSRYGLKAIIEIALAKDDECTSLRTISEKLGISENYLEQLMSALKKANLVESTRGAKGGYNLARPRNEITIGDVLRTLEGSMAPVNCVDTHKKFESSCGTSCSSECLTKQVWFKIYSTVNEAMDNITLENLVNGDDL